MDQEKIIEFIRNHPLGTLATADGKKPYASTVYFAVDHDLKLYFTTNLETKKQLNLKKNPSVAVAITNEVQGKTLQAQGTAKRLDPLPEQSKVIPLLYAVLERSFWDVPPVVLMGGKGAIYEIEPTWMRWGNFNLSETKKTKTALRKSISDK